jgi:DNA-binding response OmpR family regulator
MPGWLGSLLGKVTGGGKKRIVVVEDDSTTAKMLLAILEEKGRFEVSLAGNGLQGLDLIKEVKPAVVITDIMMPVMDGMKMLTELKKSKATKSLPVIMLTAKSKDKDIMKGYSVGADYYIPKPFTKVQVLKAVNTMITEPDKTGRSAYKLR